ncbi:uncharacterized protein ARMOST_14274 [Armillaria ostoyae]|uniref:Uncharacterized protein n=1 Tax=Armillaria ostoyae TaxID=47428 RepID=A0A284RQ40_ARMOS|nr:uncharacterized protein ARMOST_14274 [Armillaria ostoyae]
MPSYPSLDISFGALYIGAIIAAMILDAPHVALSTHALYFYLVTHFGDFVTLGAPTWYTCQQSSELR